MPGRVTVRVATFNLEDVRTEDLRRPDHPRLKRLAAQIQRRRPDILLLNEIAYDMPGAPGYREGDPAGRNGQRFADTFLAVSQAEGLEPIRYRAFMAPTNTGRPSGFDLDHDGRAVTAFPEPPPSGPDGRPAPQTPEGRAYGNDCWGFGTFPGQYAMALLVREDFEILTDSVRTFRDFPWHRLPDALRPIDPATGEPWYDDAVWQAFPLSSKSHWDVPVRLPGGHVLHLLASHPTPPAFDGPEGRNKRRNHDEIRFWAEYLTAPPRGRDTTFLIDDQGRRGGLAPDAPFVLLGDLNADPDEGSSLNDPVGTFLLRHPRIQGDFVPQAAGQSPFPDLDPDDTARWGLRVDYVLPSTGLTILDGGIDRPDDPNAPLSDHFLVWLDLALPGTGGG
ncbi:endonuclease/exonuclease/phosphatase family protein [Rhodocaloribacter litoris]|nr:endonuclease/exonuclease/phosphatase family protein [Rhodocaloribacter litoris]